MDRDSDRTPRAKRYRTDAEEETQYGDPYAQGEEEAAPRRRRSQAARLRMEETNVENTITPPSRSEAESQRRYGRPEAEPPQRSQPQQRPAQARPPQRQLPPRDPYDDDLEDEYEDDLYDSAYRDRRQPTAKTAAAKTAARKPAAKASAKRDAYDDRYDDRDDDLYDDDEDDGYDDDYDDGYGNDYDDDTPRGKGPKWWIILLVILVLVGGLTFVALRNPGNVVEPVVQFFSGLFGAEATPEPTLEPTMEPTPSPEPEPDLNAAVIVSFSAEPETQPDLNAPVEFKITTTLQTTRVEVIADEDNGRKIAEASGDEYTDIDGARFWSLRVYFPEPFEGTVVAYPGNEAGWNNASTSSTMIKVGDPSGETGGGDDGTSDGSQSNGDAGGSGGGENPVIAVGEGQGSLGTALSSSSVAEKVDLTGAVFAPSAGQLDNYSRDYTINMGDADAYRGVDGMRGVLTFRGSNLRQNAAYGTVNPTSTMLERVWTAQAGMAANGDNAFGVQPVIVQWHQDIRALMTLNGDKQNEAELKEVIFAGNNGNLYFYDLDDGQATRDALPVDPLMPMFSTPSIYPYGYPMLIVGTGDPANATMEADTGYLFYDMVRYKDIGMLKSESEYAFSNDRSVVTSQLIDNDSDTLLGIGGDGVLFTLRMNTSMNGETMTMGIEPEVVAYRSDTGERDASVDSSLAVYGEYAYYATNGGIVQCVNVNTLTPIWALDVGADTDAAIAMRIGAGGPVLYLASKPDVEGLAHMRCIDAMTGDVIWDIAVPGSISASPLVGSGVLDGYVIFSAVMAEGGSMVYALQADSGETIWEYPANSTRMASPVALYSDDGRAWIVQGDDSGLLLLDATAGGRLDHLALDGAVYGSPAAFGDMIVVATTTGNIHGVRLN